MQLKAVKSDPDPEMGLLQPQAGVIPPGSVLTAFLFSTPSLPQDFW